jgi:hypothetical protein
MTHLDLFHSNHIISLCPQAADLHTELALTTASSEHHMAASQAELAELRQQLEDAERRAARAEQESKVGLGRARCSSCWCSCWWCKQACVHATGVHLWLWSCNAQCCRCTLHR